MSRYWESQWYSKQYVLSTMEPSYLIRCSDIAGKTVLDIGCGDMSLSISHRGAKMYVGLDIAMTPLKDARLNEKNVELVRADSISLPFMDCSFDSVTSINTFTLLGAEFDRAITEAGRVLKIGGSLTFDVMHTDWHVQKGDGYTQMKTRYGTVFKGQYFDKMTTDEEGVKSALQDAGLEPKDITVLKHYQHMRLLGASSYCFCEPDAFTNQRILARALRK